MATRFVTRSLLSTLSRSYSSLSLSKPPSSISSLSYSSLLRLRPLAAVALSLRSVSPATASSLRGFATRQTSSSLNDPNPNWSNRPPKETILLDGCDFEHWLVVMEKPEGDPTRDEIIDSYIKTLATIVGSEEEARMKMYSVSTRHYYAFGALVSEEVSYKLKELPKVRWVLPDSYLDVKNKDYGGEPFINGEAVPYDPKYHEEWMRNNARANERNRRNDRPRNFDRSRNFERRREMPNQATQNPEFNPRSGPPPNVGGMQHSNMGGPPNMGGMQQPGMGGPPNMTGMQQPNRPPSVPPNMGGVPQHNYGVAPNSAPNFQYNAGPNSGGMPYQSGPGPNQNYVPNTSGNQYQNQSGPGPNQNYAPNTSGGNPYQSQPGPGPNQNYAPNTSGGSPYQSQPGPGPNQNYPPNTSGGNPYQNQNMPGRDMPPPNYQ